MFRTALALSLFLCSTGHALRTIRLMPLYLVGTTFYLKDYAGNNVTRAQLNTSYARRVGSRITIQIDLVNLSEVAQTGSLYLLPGTIQAGMGTSYAAGDYIMDSKIMLCGTSEGKTINVGRSYSATLSAGSASSVDWTIAANGFARVALELWSTGILADQDDNADPTKGLLAGANFYFSPKIGLTVNEDRGAIVGSFISTVTGIGTSGTPKSCAGNTYQFAWDGYKPAFDPAPIPVNGGRPF